jgi:hypothetical protein
MPYANNKKQDGNNNEISEDVRSVLHHDDNVSLSSISEKHIISYSRVLSVHMVGHCKVEIEKDKEDNKNFWKMFWRNLLLWFCHRKN